MEAVTTTTNIVDTEYVLNQYAKRIAYYWGASRHNKKAYKSYRTLSIILGSAVTLVSSLSAASFVQDSGVAKFIFAVATPIIAATLTVISGLGQNFHWGATWRDMVVNAVRLEQERDRFLATPPAERDLVQALNVLNTLVMEETKTFFQRVLDSEIRPTEKSNGNNAE